MNTKLGRRFASSAMPNPFPASASPAIPPATLPKNSLRVIPLYPPVNFGDPILNYPRPSSESNKAFLSID